MAAVLESTAPAVRAGAGRLRGFMSGAREIDDAPVAVAGALPDWLQGSLLLNGPALWELPHGALRHWFDGFAMLHRISLGAAGGPRYRSRFARSDAYQRSVAAGTPATGEFGTPNPASLWQRLRGARGTDNPAVVMSRHGTRWIAVSETPFLTYFDPHTLATEQRVDLHEAARIQLMAAHGFTLPDGSYLNVGVEFGPRCKYRVFRLAPGAQQPQTLADIPVAKPGYLHGFALAAGHAIVWDCALRANVLAFRFGGAAYKDNFRWSPESGSFLHAVALDGGAVRSWKIPALMAFHAVQAWSEGDELVVEIAAFDDATVFDDLMLDRRRAAQPMRAVAHLVRYRLRPGRDAAEAEPIGVDLELPQVHPASIGFRRARVCWGVGGGSSGDFGEHIARVDLDRGSVSTWQRPAATHLEPLFVPRPGGVADDDGVLLVPTLADDDPGSVIALLDAASLGCLAELHLPQVVPFGFHAAYDPA